MKNDLKEKFNHKIKKTKNRKYDFDTISGEKLDTVYFPNEFGEKYKLSLYDWSEVSYTTEKLFVDFRHE